MKKNRCALLLALQALTVLARSPAHAAQYGKEWSPDLNAYFQLAPSIRGVLSAERSPDRSHVLEAGPSMDFSFAPLLRAAIVSPDMTRHRRLTARAGYRYLLDPGGADEHRVLLELTPRQALPFSFALSDRNRADLRWIGGISSWRYRNRLTAERSFAAAGLTATPFARVEWFHDSRYAQWNRTAYGGGVRLPFDGRAELEAYFERDRDVRASPRYLDTVGFTVSLFFPPRPLTDAP